MSLAVPGAPQGLERPAVPTPRAAAVPAPRVPHRAVIAEALDNRRCPRRVRYEVRDGVAVAAFSAASSTVAALAFSFLLSRVG